MTIRLSKEQKKNLRLATDREYTGEYQAKHIIIREVLKNGQEEEIMRIPKGKFFII